MTATMQDFLPDSAFLLDQPAEDWKAAIRLAGKGLEDSGFTTAAYTDEMISTVEKMGPYIVISPGLALAHSRPSEAVLHTGLSWVRLSTPVEFGNKANDPVSLVIGLAGRNEEEHLQVMSAIAKALSNPASKNSLNDARTPDEIRAILNG
ncbi:MAG: PTS sugar transporter subunit IIA [Bifidobacterium crudilactis]|jgi:ascorbate PTS system EIIA or EIIAB component|uniref:Ascorbate-specific PTS system EIIA component n=1 Tax=Bifidobacterium crudilactis TaxID=327277 RepID=A0A971D129_9BIFI|nr:PTS sugar transporter subunit IIA [Bifidobacterium crudilactis]MCI1637057.1 PTS sugar transporter subunit IIA [Bifidobacterium crudilactis]MCI1642971.1 PTS sugar transporter subunit IIA [Bifidobacterium crudilactis]MCI1889106.1 PTS sugar transporter subunit IIA [Bifidobacterium crudilactis]NLT80356.1 PTS sugar transporter subunit IIA [Bifidobacterium crudilactis]